MSVLSALYQILIGPLELLFDMIYSLAYRLIGNQGLVIIVLSLCMNALVLPLYRRADAMQAEERELERKLEPGTKHIKKVFSGDERFMVLQTFYRQNNYKPSYALRGSLPLLLQVPFFIAAYRFLSGLAVLEGVSFGPIRDLSQPDALLHIGGYPVNLLPILMTAINLCSCFVYARNLPARSKLQMYGLALIFLVLLYPSPAGLVFYWTLNNLFSLGKNLLSRLKRPGRVLCVMSSAAGAGLLAFILLIHPMNTAKHQLYAVALTLMMQAPLLILLLGKRKSPVPEPEISGQDRTNFRLGCAVLTVLTGLLIPSAVIRSSPSEFVDINAFRSPLLYVLHALLLATGAFMIWLGIFFSLSGPKGKRALELGVWIGSGCALIDYMAFGTDLGTLSPTLQLENGMHFSGGQILVNLLVLAAAAAVLFFLWKKKRELAKFALLAAAAALLCMSAVNTVKIQSAAAELAERTQVRDRETGTEAAAAKDMPNFPLSRNGKNVAVLMMDRAVGAYFPFLLHEKPELKEQFSGFVFYPDTLSFGCVTNVASPSLYGGYEYRPAEINRRSGERLEDKHNEALKVMPVLFDQNGYTVTLFDPPFAGYQWYPDMSIYDDYPEMRAFNTWGKFMDEQEDSGEQIQRSLDRNFFCYGLVKCLPLVCQPYLYDSGTYSETNTQASKPYQTRYGRARSSGLERDFMWSYTMLTHLPAITEIQDSAEDTFLMLYNCACHDVMMLKEPEYVPAEIVDNTEYDAEHWFRETDDGRSLTLETERQAIHYQCNMASMLQLGAWFDWLREQGLYDNTRIIIVADHGYSLTSQFPELVYFDGALDAMWYNPLLLVKDFNSSGPLTTDPDFMTNADVPSLAFAGLIEDPVNPFTGKPINSEPKNAEELFVFTSREYDVLINNGNTFLPAPWYSVHGSIFGESNWSANVDERVK